MPNVSSIPAGLPFAKTLAAELLDRTKTDPASLSRILVLLPTRRACRVLREAFLDLRGEAPLLLPRMQPIGDLDEEELALNLLGQDADALSLSIKPALSPYKRQILLAALIQRMKPDQPHDQCLGFAKALGHLMDQVYTEDLDLKNIADLVDHDFAAHWEITVTFLKILSEQWPKILEAEGCIDQADRRNKLILALCAYWDKHPPLTPVIAAGSTGSIPSVAKLLSVVAGLPQGELILPGLDTEIDEESWLALEETHPQYGFKHLLDPMNISRTDVKTWKSKAHSHPLASARRFLGNEIMRPSATVNAWGKLGVHKTELERSLQNLKILTCNDEGEEASAIALLLRETLETPDKTACLITPDRALAERVKQACLRWNITLDDSAGLSFDKTPLGVFIVLVLQAATEGFSPLSLMALLKHRLFRMGHSGEGLYPIVENIDLMLRGPKPARGLPVLIEQAQQHSEISEFLKTLNELCAPLSDELANHHAVSPQALLKTLLQLCENLAATDQSAGSEMLWKDLCGVSASAFFAELLPVLSALPPLSGAHKAEDFLNILLHFLKQLSIRPPYGTHPRLHILGQLEARLIDADLVIMSGLNEGTWPPDTGADPWMSRPMRKKFKLPSLERSIGLAAHDFIQALCMNEVILTRSQRKESAPSVPARWLLRLDAVMQAAGLSWDEMQSQNILHWVRTLDSHELRLGAKRPVPCPPVALRPLGIRLTDVETWLKDPYSIYAKYILGLEKIDALEENLDAAERGTLLHKILQRFIEEDGTPLKDIAKQELEKRHIDESLWSFWWPRFERFAAWFEQQKTGTPLKVETSGRLAYKTPRGDFTIKGRADRIDRDDAGGAIIIDYKSGGTYTKTQIQRGDRPQLPIEALMLAQGGFEGLGAMKTRAVEYWVCHGRGEGGEIISIEGALDDITQQTNEGLKSLIATFENPDTPYTCLPHAGKAPDYNDYEHLARIAEWSMEGESEAEGET